mgnify:CR=1 FL=1
MALEYIIELYKIRLFIGLHYILKMNKMNGTRLGPEAVHTAEEMTNSFS